MLEKKGFKGSMVQGFKRNKTNIEQGMSNWEVIFSSLRYLPAVIVAGSIPCSIFCGSL